MTYCSYHCRACGAHFASLDGFDAHRVGRFEPDERRCTPLGRVRVLDGARGELYPRSGSCRIGDPLAPVADAIVWQRER